MTKVFHQYLDLDVFNDDAAANARPPQLSFEETRTHPILEGDSSDYFVTIARFRVQTGSTLPVFIPSIVTGQSDINKTVYIISYKSVATQEVKQLNITYVPSNLNTALPASPINGQDVQSRYYYVKYYQDFVNMVNKTLKKLWTATIYPPFIEFDPTSFQFVFNVPQNEFFTTPTYELYFNSRLFNLFAGLPFIFTGYDGDQNYKLNVAGSSNNTRQVLAIDGFSKISFIQLFSEVSSVDAWNPINSIVFTTSTLPIVPSQTSPAKLYNSSSNGLTASGVSNIANILSDFEIPISASNQYRSEISYVPPGEYRLIDMYSNQNLFKIDLNAFWRDRYGNLIPLLLEPGCSASIKIMFRHKHFYLGYA